MADHVVPAYLNSKFKCNLRYYFSPHLNEVVSVHCDKQLTYYTEHLQYKSEWHRTVISKTFRAVSYRVISNSLCKRPLLIEVHTP